MKNQKQTIVPQVAVNAGLNVNGIFYTMKRSNSAWVMIKIVVENNKVVSETTSDHDLMTIISAKLLQEIHKESE